MPFAVKKWPDECDPRTPCFCLKGYAFGAVPPYKFLVSTTNATGYWSILNTGVIVEWFTETGAGLCSYSATLLSPTRFIRVDISALPNWQTVPPPEHTLKWLANFRHSDSGDTIEGSASARLPDPVGMPPSIDVSPLSGPDLIPDPVALTPQPWDA